MPFTNEGEILILDVFTGETSPPANLYVALVTSAPGETTTLATMSEVSGSGYSRQLITFDPAGLDSGDGQADSSTVTFTATGTWTGATHAVLTDAASGTSGNLISYRSLSTTRTLGNGDTMDVTYDLKAQ